MPTKTTSTETRPSETSPDPLAAENKLEALGAELDDLRRRTIADLVRPADEYSLGKCVAEAYCAHFASTSGLEVTSMRPFSVYGPGMDLRTGYCGALLDAVVTGAPVVLSGSPDFSRDFVHLETVVDVVVAAVTNDAPLPALLNIGSGVSTTLAELVEIFSDQVCRSLSATYSTPRPGTLDRTLADISLMSDVTCAHIPDLTTGVREMVQALQARR